MSRRTLLNYTGLVILLAGLSAGVLIYRHAGSGADDEDVADSIYTSRVYERNVEMYSGTFGLIMDQWTRDIAKLGRPRPLAMIISLISTLAAGGCFIAASGMPRRD